MQQKLQKLKINILFFLELQLLISITILPILIAWGLPISIMTIIGNLVFAQFLTLFIFISTLLFTCDLLGIPNQFIVLILEWITQIWHYCLSFGSADWLIGFPTWVYPISCICAAIACSLYYPTIYQQKYRILILSSCIVTLFCIPIIFQSYSIQTTIEQGSGKMHLIKHGNTIYAFDCGALGARPSSQSWIEFTLTPLMIQKLGTRHIDALFLCRSNSRTPQAVQALTEHIPTKKIIKIEKKSYLPTTKNPTRLTFYTLAILMQHAK